MIITNKIKQTYILLFISVLFSFVLLYIRMVMTKTPFYLFLVWNLFLACIPYLITCYLITKQKHNTFKLALIFLVWLLFLPNAPYIITDLYHLRLGKPRTIWIDLLVISSFASTGLLLFYLTIIDMKQVLINHFNAKYINRVFPILFFLTGFGVYLGRFLRFNSWELINNSSTILNTIFKILINPITYYKAWGFSICFGILLLLGFQAIQLLKRKT